MDALALDEGLMIRTAFPDHYRELVEQQKLFPFMYDLFVLALMVGVLRACKSGKRKEGDIIKVGQIKNEETRLALEVVCSLLPGEDEHSRWAEALAYADGGLERLWHEIQTLGHLDTLRLLSEAKEKWPTKLQELLKETSLPTPS